MRQTIARQQAARDTIDDVRFVDEPITQEFLDRVRYRMLHLEESARIAGFEWDYEFDGTARQQAAGIGNAVTPSAARWLADRIVDANERGIVRAPETSLTL